MKVTCIMALINPGIQELTRNIIGNIGSEKSSLVGTNYKTEQLTVKAQ